MGSQSNKIEVEVVYATPRQQFVESVTIAAGSTAAEVIECSRVLTRFTEIDLANNKIGSYSRLIRLDSVVEDGERIEIYRPLKADPKMVRRQLAEEGKTMGRASKNN